MDQNTPVRSGGGSAPLPDEARAFVAPMGQEATSQAREALDSLDDFARAPFSEALTRIGGRP